MSHTPHELHDEFPNESELIHKMKMSDSHFAKLADRYHDTNREIHRIESEIEAASDERSENLKKQRLAMLDEIQRMLSKEKADA